MTRWNETSERLRNAAVSPPLLASKQWHGYRPDAPPIFERLSMSGETWCELVRNFGRLFYNVAGHPQQIEAARSGQTNRRFHITSAARSLFATASGA